MHIAIESLSSEPKRVAGTVAAPRDRGFERADVGPIAFALELRRDDAVVRVGGWMHAVAHPECSRCLERTRLVLDRRLELELRPAAAVSDEAERELDEAELAIEYYVGEDVDLRDILAEHVVLGFPMKILCAEGCRGLCPQCGGNRNRQACGCEPPIDPRLADLKGLRDRL